MGSKINISQRRRSSYNFKCEFDIITSLEILGISSWQELELNPENAFAFTDTFDKELLDNALRKKILELEFETQPVKVQTLSLENMSKQEKVLYNRKMMQAIESGVKSKNGNRYGKKERQLRKAYQLVLTEHYKRMNRLTRISAASRNGKKPLPIQTEEDKCADSLKVDAGQNNSKIKGAKKSKHGKKRRKSTALKRSASSDKLGNESTHMNQSKSKDTLTTSIGDLVRSQSSTNVAGESKWKRKIKKLQATSAVTKMFCSAGNQASTASWKLLLQ